MDKKFLRLVIGFFLLVALLAAGVAIWQMKVVRHGGFEFRVHRDRYEDIVHTVDTLLRGDAEMALFFASDLSKPGNVQRSYPTEAKPERGAGAGWIWASRTKGNLVVWIETLDQGHAGEYGYVFSSNGQPPAWNHDAFGERWTITQHLEENWWTIEYRLD